MNRPPNLAELGRRCGVSRETLRAWRKSGLDLTDPAAIKRKIAGMRRPPAGASLPAEDGQETYLEARRRREIALANRAELLAQREARELIPLAGAERAFAVLGARLRGHMLALIGTLPGQLEGMSAPAMQDVLREAIFTFLENLDDPKYDEV